LLLLAGRSPLRRRALPGTPIAARTGAFNCRIKVQSHSRSAWPKTIARYRDKKRVFVDQVCEYIAATQKKSPMKNNSATSSACRFDRPRASPLVRRTVLIACVCASALAGHLAHAGSVSYGYDALGRLASAVFSNGTSTTSITYSYDAAGNRTSVVTTSP